MPQRDSVRIECAQITDGLDALFPEERELVAGAAPKRQREFSTGRNLARRAMSELGLDVGPVLKGAQREPCWPAGVLGSLTHADDCAIACVASAGAVRSVGVDLEVFSRVDEKLHDRLFTQSERLFLAGAGPELAGLLFSAKEAGYKATYPLTGRYIGFHEAEVCVNQEAATFRFRYVGENEDSSVMEQGEGHFVFSGRYVFSLVFIP